jgi:high-affinity iron transporter
MTLRLVNQPIGGLVLGNALIGLREGSEAALVVSILVAFLVKSNRRRELPKVWLGVGLATLVSVGVTLGLTLTEQALTFRAKETVGGLLSILAVGFVTWMIFWMRSNARAMSSEQRGKLESAIQVGPVAVVVMALLPARPSSTSRPRSSGWCRR